MLFFGWEITKKHFCCILVLSDIKLEKSAGQCLQGDLPHRQTPQLLMHQEALVKVIILA